MSNIKVVGLGGSLKPESTSEKALRIALRAAAEQGADTQLVTLVSLDLPLFAPDQELPGTARRFAEQVAECDAMLWASPVYHGGMSGSFKNAIDFLELLAKHEPPYLTNKVVGLIATAGGVQSLQAINSMEFCVRALRGFAHPLTAPVDRAWQLFAKDGTLTDEKTLERLRAVGAGVVQAARGLRQMG
ncbi:MAG TPA: NADPH-dependent FMN reductase [Pseudomonadota bacterium]|jgi:FMN reductase|nr:NADPH-dependent FMN reductase [Pseudomonadota bacterium]